MLTMRRSVRIQETLLLPNGERVRIDVDVEANLLPLNAALCKTTAAAQKFVEDPDSDGARAAFYGEFAGLVKALLGEAGYRKALEAYDGHAEELCEQLDEWIRDEVTPKITEASHRRAERLKATARKVRRAG